MCARMYAKCLPLSELTGLLYICKRRSDSCIHLLLVVPSLIPPRPTMLPYALTRLQYQSIRTVLGQQRPRLLF